MLIITIDDELGLAGAGSWGESNTGSQWSEVMGAGSWALWAEAIMGTGAGHKAHSHHITAIWKRGGPADVSAKCHNVSA